MKSGGTLEPKTLLRYGLQGLAFGAVATVVVLGFTVRRDTLAQLDRFAPGYIVVLFSMVFTAWAGNGARMWLMCWAAGHPLRYRQAIAVSLSTEFGIAATPAGVGGTVIRLSLLRKAGVPVATAASLMATDAAVDLVFFSLLAPFAGFILLHDRVLRAVIHQPSRLDASFALAALVALAVVIIVMLRSEGCHRRAERLLGWTAFGRRKRLPARYRHWRATLRRTTQRLVASLGFLWRRRKSALVANLAVASVQWCCRYLLLPVILRAFGIHVNPVPLFLVQGILFALSLVVIAPGGGGAVELLTALILPGLAPSAITGVIVLLWRFFTYHLYVIGGGMMFFWVCRRTEQLFPATPEPRLKPT